MPLDDAAILPKADGVKGCPETHADYNITTWVGMRITDLDTLAVLVIDRVQIPEHSTLIAGLTP